MLDLNLEILHVDSTTAKLTVTGDNKIRIKVNPLWEESTKNAVISALISAAEVIINLNLGYTVRGRLKLRELNYDPIRFQVFCARKNKEHRRKHTIKLVQEK